MKKVRGGGETQREAMNPEDNAMMYNLRCPKETKSVVATDVLPPPGKKTRAYYYFQLVMNDSF